MDDTGSAPFRSKNEGLEDVVSFNSIEVIESLPSDQLQTGTNLYEAVIRPLAYPLDPPVFVRHHSIRTTDGLHDLLREISAEAVAKHRSPILHFEAHGNADGLPFEAATLVRTLLLGRRRRAPGRRQADRLVGAALSRPSGLLAMTDRRPYSEQQLRRQTTRDALTGGCERC
jgi:hypothetical protein